MRRLLLALTTLSLVAPAGCDASSPGAEPAGVAQLKQALPDADTMTIQLPQSSALVPQQAGYYAFTRDITVQVNGLVRDITNVIEDVVDYPPSDTDGATYAVWGPWTEALSPATYRVTVTAAAEGGYDYLVEGWPKDADDSAAVTLLAGHHVDGAGPHRGSGGWAYDLSVAHELDPIAQPGTGRIEITYTLAAARALDVTFTDVQGPGDPLKTTALYRYTEAADGAGTFDFTSNLDIHAGDDATLDRRELVQVRSRWLASGPGRADVLASHGDLPAGVEVNATECWDAGFVRTFLELSFPGTEETEGEASACPYADRQLPEFEGFDADAFADSALVLVLPDEGDVDVVPTPVAEETSEPALYYQIASDTMEALRSEVGGVLEMVHDATRAPASACDEDGCRWGPWTDWSNALSVLVYVTRNDDGTFGYQVLMQHLGDAPDAWQRLVEGGHRDDGDDKGYGWFVFDLDVLSEFNADEHNTGSYRAEYVRDGQHAALQVRVDQVILDGGQEPTDARFFIAAADGTGYLDMRVFTDIHHEADKTAEELVEARIRWVDTGAGVADILVTGGDLGESTEALAVECWDEHAAETHMSFVPRAIGESSMPILDGPGCVFSDWQGVDFPAMGDEQP